MLRSALAAVLAVALAPAAHAATLTFNSLAMGSSSAATPLELTFALRNHVTEERPTATVTATVYVEAIEDATTFTIDETTAASFGIADWEEWSTLPESPEWRSFVYGWEGGPSNIGGAMFLQTFVVDHVDLTLELWREAPNHALRLAVEVVGEGTVPEPKIASLATVLLAACAFVRRR
jgi:hypothetical protein